MCEVKAHHEIEKERKAGHFTFARKIGQSAVSSVARGKLRFYHLHNLDAHEAASFYRSEYAASQLTQLRAEKYRKEINVGTRRYRRCVSARVCFVRFSR